MVNYVEITGNLASNPDYYDTDDTGSDTSFCTFDVECKQEIINEIFCEETACFSCIAFDDWAWAITDGFIEGMPIHIWGHLYMHSWEDRNGDLHTSTKIQVQKAIIEGEDKREKNSDGEYIKKTRRELRKHRRAVGILFREKFGAPGWEDLFSKEELKNTPDEKRYKLLHEREKEWFEKKGIPNPNELVSQDEKDNLSIEKLEELLEERSDEWYRNALNEQSAITEKNMVRYFLEQSIIPNQLFSEDGKAFIICLRKEQGAFLLSLLNAYEDLSVGEGYKCPYHAEQFIVKSQMMKTSDDKLEFVMLTIEMPEPESAPLCSHLIICHDLHLDRIQYYTIEKSIGHNHFMICGVNENGMHLDFGDAPNTPQEVIERVRELYTIALVFMED